MAVHLACTNPEYVERIINAYIEGIDIYSIAAMTSSSPDDVNEIIDRYVQGLTC